MKVVTGHGEPTAVAKGAIKETDFLDQAYKMGREVKS